MLSLRLLPQKPMYRFLFILISVLIIILLGAGSIQRPAPINPVYEWYKSHPVDMRMWCDSDIETTTVEEAMERDRICQGLEEPNNCFCLPRVTHCFCPPSLP
jgi:hypothetical protein